MSRFKPGDRVVVRSYGNMLSEQLVTKKPGFPPEMSYLCGRKYTVKAVQYWDAYGCDRIWLEETNGFYFAEWMFEYAGCERRSIPDVSDADIMAVLQGGGITIE